jgi:membrane-associated phospholipid phosphatase
MASEYSLENWISLTAVAYLGIPAFLFVTFGNMIAFRLVVLIMLADLITVSIKYKTRNLTWKFLKRPEGAEGCGSFLGGKNQGGQPGFPSGHVATAAAFWTSIYWLVPLDYRKYVVVLGALATVAMIWARMKKSCHTLIQTLAGGVVGGLIGWFGGRWVF